MEATQGLPENFVPTVPALVEFNKKLQEIVSDKTNKKLMKDSGTSVLCIMDVRGNIPTPEGQESKEEKGCNAQGHLAVIAGSPDDLVQLLVETMNASEEFARMICAVHAEYHTQKDLTSMLLKLMKRSR